jgi:ribonuclease P protein component
MAGGAGGPVGRRRLRYVFTPDDYELKEDTRGNEAHVSAAQTASEEDPRIPAADEHARRAAGAEGAAAARPEAIDTRVGRPVERARRLRKGSEFDTVYQKGTVVSGPLLVVRHLKAHEAPARWGFAVGKRISKKAVERNRVRRRLREGARQLAVADGHDIVVTARARALDGSFAELQEGLRAALKRAGLLVEAAEC